MRSGWRDLWPFFHIDSKRNEEWLELRNEVEQLKKLQ